MCKNFIKGTLNNWKENIYTYNCILSTGENACAFPLPSVRLYFAHIWNRYQWISCAAECADWKVKATKSISFQRRVDKNWIHTFIKFWIYFVRFIMNLQEKTMYRMLSIFHFTSTRHSYWINNNNNNIMWKRRESEKHTERIVQCHFFGFDCITLTTSKQWFSLRWFNANQQKKKSFDFNIKLLALLHTHTHMRTNEWYASRMPTSDNGVSNCVQTST